MKNFKSALDDYLKKTLKFRENCCMTISDNNTIIIDSPKQLSGILNLPKWKNEFIK